MGAPRSRARADMTWKSIRVPHFYTVHRSRHDGPASAQTGVPLHRAAHAARPAPPPPQLAARDLDHLDALLAQMGVGGRRSARTRPPRPARRRGRCSRRPTARAPPRARPASRSGPGSRSSPSAAAIARCMCSGGWSVTFSSLSPHARFDGVRAEHAQPRVLGEGVAVDHRHHRVEVHEGPPLGHVERHDRAAPNRPRTARAPASPRPAAWSARSSR